MIVIEKVNSKFPFDWVNAEDYTLSNAKKVEIYIKKEVDIISQLIIMFYDFYKTIKDDLYIYNSSWWDYSIETWDFEYDQYDYNINNKSEATSNYLKTLIDSNIEIGYSGSCKCLEWDIFLEKILDCLISHQAPYSPILYSEKYQLFFYFHHSGSIGLYYKQKNSLVNSIIKKAEQFYIIEY